MEQQYEVTNQSKLKEVPVYENGVLSKIELIDPNNYLVACIIYNKDGKTIKYIDKGSFNKDKRLLLGTRQVFDENEPYIIVYELTESREGLVGRIINMDSMKNGVFNKDHALLNGWIEKPDGTKLKRNLRELENGYFEGELEVDSNGWVNSDTIIQERLTSVLGNTKRIGVFNKDVILLTGQTKFGKIDKVIEERKLEEIGNNHFKGEIKRLPVSYSWNIRYGYLASIKFGRETFENGAFDEDLDLLQGTKAYYDYFGIIGSYVEEQGEFSKDEKLKKGTRKVFTSNGEKLKRMESIQDSRKVGMVKGNSVPEYERLKFVQEINTRFERARLTCFNGFKL